MNDEHITTEEVHDAEVAHEVVPEVYKIPVARQLLLLAVILLLIFGNTLAPKLLAMLPDSNSIPAAIGLPERSDVPEKSTKEITKAFENTKITAQSAYVWDIAQQKVLYKKNESDRRPLASVTKLMTALLAQEILSETENVTIDATSILQDGDSGLKEGEVFNRLSLSDLVLMSSSNDGAYALAVKAGNVLKPKTGATSFVQAMNIRAQEIGLTQTQFKNPTGLDISPTEVGATGSARDMAFLMEYIVQNEPDILTYTREDIARVYAETGEHHDAENTNYYIDEIPGLIGSKTGYTELAGGNLVIAFNIGLNRPIAIVVLGSTQQERFTDVMKLVEESQKYALTTDTP